MAKTKKPTTPKRLPQSKWAAAGIILVRNQFDLSVPTHAVHGDQRAEDIISGRYDHQRACMDTQRNNALVFQLSLFGAGAPTAASTFLDITSRRKKR